MPAGQRNPKKAATPKAKAKAKAQRKRTASFPTAAKSARHTATGTRKRKLEGNAASESKAKEMDNSVSVHISKFRFQYVNSLPVSQMQAGSTYFDRVSLSIPCKEVWSKVLSDPRFSRAGAFIPLCELSSEKLKELAVCVWRNLSEQGRRHLGEQYWRARAQSFENYLKKHIEEGEKAEGGAGESGGQGQSSTTAGASAGHSIPDPEPLTENHRDPYLMICPGKHLLGGKRKTSQKTNEKETSDNQGNHAQSGKRYNALRQSQNISDSPTQFINSLRCCYAEVAAPKGALVLLRGNSHNQSGKQVLAEYARSPKEDLELWRDADADEALAGYVDAATGRRVAYPWRQRLVRVICEVPKTVMVTKGSGSLRKQLNSAKLMKELDVKMLRDYAKVASKAQSRSRSKTDPKKNSAKQETTLPQVVKRTSATDSCKDTPGDVVESKRRKIDVSLSAVMPHPCTRNQPSHPSFQALYDLLEKTYFPTGHRVNVAGYEGVSYLIFGAHRGARYGPCANQLELTEVTRLAYGKLKPEEVMEEDEEHTTKPKFTQQQVDHHRILLELLLRHFQQVGLDLNKGRIHDPLRDKSISSQDVFYSSVMVAKNKRTFFHRDRNNFGPSFQVVVSDPSKVDSGEFRGGNLLAWPTLGKEEAEKRVCELREFWEVRRKIRSARKERMAHVNPVNARWTGEGDKVEINSKTGKLLKSSITAGGATTDTVEKLLLDKCGDIGLRNVPDESIVAARAAVYYGDQPEDEQCEEDGEPTHDEDATVVPCVHKYISFYGKECYHATEPWTRGTNRYCITFFGVKVDGRHSSLRAELEEIGFKPHPEGMNDADDGDGEEE